MEDRSEILKAYVSMPSSASPVVDTLERIRLTANLAKHDWLDLLGLQYTDYQAVKAGSAQPTEKLIERVAEHFGFAPENLLSGDIDFKNFALERDHENSGMQNYLKAAYGRRRTSITSVEFLEESFGWRLRLDALRALHVSEEGLNDAFAPISINFITDLCGYLSRRQFKSREFFAMGSHAFQGNRNTIVSKIFSDLKSSSETFEFFCSEAIKLFEQNCIYKIVEKRGQTLIIEISTNPHVAAETGKRLLGSRHVCDVKRGLIAHLPCYIGQKPASVIESRCAHKGDSVCRFEIDFSQCETTTH